MAKNKVPVYKLPVMKAHCASCPFKPDKDGRWQNTDLANTVIARTLFKAQQICHSTSRNRCKGAYDHNLVIYQRLGWDHLLIQDTNTTSTDISDESKIFKYAEDQQMDKD